MGDGSTVARRGLSTYTFWAQGYIRRHTRKKYILQPHIGFTASLAFIVWALLAQRPDVRYTDGWDSMGVGSNVACCPPTPSICLERFSFFFISGFGVIQSLRCEDGVGLNPTLSTAFWSCLCLTILSMSLRMLEDQRCKTWMGKELLERRFGPAFEPRYRPPYRPTSSSGYFVRSCVLQISGIRCRTGRVKGRSRMIPWID